MGLNRLLPLLVALLAALPPALALDAEPLAPFGLAADTPVLGVAGDDGAATVAFLEVLVSQRGLVHDTVHGRALMVVNTTEGPRAYWTGERAFRLEGGVLVDENGGEWDPVTGEGPAGARLEAPRQEHVTWAQWLEEHPDSRVHALLLARVTPAGTEGDAVRVRFSEPVNRTAVTALVPVGVRVAWEDERTLALTSDAPREKVTIPPGAYGLHGGVLHHPLGVPLQVDGATSGSTPRLRDGDGVVMVLGAGGAAGLLLFAWLARRGRRA